MHLFKNLAKMFFFADRLVYCCVKVAVEKRFTIQQHIAIRDKRVILEYIMKYNEENKLKKNKKKISHNVVYFIVIVYGRYTTRSENFLDLVQPFFRVIFR